MKRINIIYDIEKILLEIESLDIKSMQISLQSPDGSFTTGVGKIEWNPGYEETDFIANNLPKEWETSRFIKDLNLYRTRVMTLEPKQCYSWHYDRSPRIHLALQTHKHCFFIEDNNLIHIPADGYPYWIDTTKYHTAMNCTLDMNRIHLVGCTNK